MESTPIAVSIVTLLLARKVREVCLLGIEHRGLSRDRAGCHVVSSGRFIYMVGSTRVKGIVLAQKCCGSGVLLRDWRRLRLRKEKGIV